ncbi:MAG: hydantoinase B/oxoprolinase family protein [Rhodocyclaceae bacterium]|nr:hydantoinase B/oxoprolinase family protein [Rhodocyclaceae bacterium]MCA4901564.1 hydantoinase B/oxoprolinase family protein [Rhodocyclaceae bacterium]
MNAPTAAGTIASTTRDPIAFELFKNSVAAIADEMAVTVHRTSYTSVVKNNMDFSTAFADGDGVIVAQGLTLSGHLGAIPVALQSVMKCFEGDIHPGDVFAMNDPFEGGMHLPDIFVFQPIFVDGRRLAFACTIAHHTDVGGRVPGSSAADSTEIFQEGIRIPPIKLFDRGVKNFTFFRIFEANVRVPDKVVGDLTAQLSACYVAEKQFLELVERYGTDTVAFFMKEINIYAERVTRAAIEKLPDGEWSFEDWIDDDGVDRDKPIRLFVTVRKHGDEMEVDYTGSSPQVRGAINSTYSYSCGSAWTAVRAILPQDIPNAEGASRPIRVTAPEGTIANVIMPGACAARAMTGFRMTDATFGALAQMLPDNGMTASDGGNTNVSIGGYYRDRKSFIYVDFTCGSWGARAFDDGHDGLSHIKGNMASHAVESIEAEYPIQFLSYEFVPDKFGPGKYRGGAPYRRDYRFLEGEAVLSVRADRKRFPAFGLYGGQPGRPSENVLNPGTSQEEPLTGKFTRSIHRGDVFRTVLAGGGGWGDPLERDPARVLRDVRNELLSDELARSQYGVVVDRKHWLVDEAGTHALRESMRAARGGAPLPFVTHAWPADFDGTDIRAIEASRK